MSEEKLQPGDRVVVRWGDGHECSAVVTDELNTRASDGTRVYVVSPVDRAGSKYAFNERDLTRITRVTPAKTYLDALVERKRARVGVASTVLDPLPSTRTSDTSLVVRALSAAVSTLDAQKQVTILSPKAEQALEECRQALAVVRGRILQESPDTDTDAGEEASCLTS